MTHKQIRLLYNQYLLEKDFFERYGSKNVITFQEWLKIKKTNSNIMTIEESIEISKELDKIKKYWFERGKKEVITVPELYGLIKQKVCFEENLECKSNKDKETILCNLIDFVTEYGDKYYGVIAKADVLNWLKSKLFDDTISKNILIEQIQDCGLKIYNDLGHDRIDPYRQGIIDGYKNVIKIIKTN